MSLAHYLLKMVCIGGGSGDQVRPLCGANSGLGFGNPGSGSAMEPELIALRMSQITPRWLLHRDIRQALQGGILGCDPENGSIMRAKCPCQRWQHAKGDTPAQT